MKKRPPAVETKIFAKPRQAEAERLVRLEWMAERRRVEAAEAAQALCNAMQEEQAAWTAEKSQLVEVARLAEAEAASWARALALAVRDAAKTLAAREKLYTDAEQMVSEALKKF